MISLEQLEHRRAYRLKSRNLLVGFWDEVSEGFYGVREKFNNRFVDHEELWQEKWGTAHALEPLDLWLPQDIPLASTLASVCRDCGKETEHIWETDDTYHSGQKCVGHRHFYDVHNEACPRGGPGDYMAVVPQNQELFNLLDIVDAQFEAERMAEWDDRTNS